jgi:hypothetical protein
MNVNLILVFFALGSVAAFASSFKFILAENYRHRAAWDGYVTTLDPDTKQQTRLFQCVQVAEETLGVTAVSNGGLLVQIDQQLVAYYQKENGGYTHRDIDMQTTSRRLFANYVAFIWRNNAGGIVTYDLSRSPDSYFSFLMDQNGVIPMDFECNVPTKQCWMLYYKNFTSLMLTQWSIITDGKAIHNVTMQQTVLVQNGMHLLRIMYSAGQLMGIGCDSETACWTAKVSPTTGAVVTQKINVPTTESLKKFGTFARKGTMDAFALGYGDTSILLLDEHLNVVTVYVGILNNTDLQLGNSFGYESIS